MSAKICYRRKGDRVEATEPIVVALQDPAPSACQKHLYLAELIAIAEAGGAGLVELPRVKRHEHQMYHGEEDVAAAAAI